MVAIKGHFDGKVFVPDEPVALPRGQTVILHVETMTQPEPQPADEQHVLEWIVQNLANKTDLPADGSHQHDHYIYGTPKREP
jgi:hypothetical protein